MSASTSRLAPSPTGAQHLGNARTFLLAWLSARAQGSRVVLRVEDLDSPRVKPWATQQAIDDLRWLGLDWDEGPDVGGPHGPYIQTQRRERYSAALVELQAHELVYPCTCTRSDVASAASAPHAGQEGFVYPGTCRHRTVADAATIADRPFAWRFRTDRSRAAASFEDLVAGPQRCDVAVELGDFVVAKSSGCPAYQLAVVVDDHEMGVTEVVRGDDLLPSTFRQLLLYDAFGWLPPRFAHAPLVVGSDGRRLAKRHGDTRLSVLREACVPAERLVGFLAFTCGLLPADEPISARELIDGFAWRHVPKRALVFTPEMWQTLLARP
jgi:glutamyl-tRNA synthetase